MFSWWEKDKTWAKKVFHQSLWKRTKDLGLASSLKQDEKTDVHNSDGFVTSVHKLVFLAT